MTTPRFLTEAEKEHVRGCAQLTGCALFECLKIDNPCWKNKEWDVSKPARGLGDVVAKITHATGIDKVAQYLFPATEQNPQGCGCKQRQEALNNAVPFENKGM